VSELPFETMVMAMSVSRRFKAIISNNLALKLHAVMKAIEEERLKVMLTFAPPALAGGFLLCRHGTVDEMSGYVTIYSTTFQPEPLSPNPGPPRNTSSKFYCQRYRKARADPKAPNSIQ
jgi:hypothetical protein